jgi:integrase
MPLEYQRGSVYLRGKRCKTWYGKYRVWHKDTASGTWVTKQKNKKIGLKSGMTKFDAEHRLREMIAGDNGSEVNQSVQASQGPVTLKWFVEQRHLPMMSCRATTKKKTCWEISRYLLERFGDRPIQSIGQFELQTHLNKIAQIYSDSVTRHLYSNVRSIFSNAVELDFLIKSPARKLKMPDTRPPDRSTLEAANIMRLLNAIDDPMDRCLFAIAVFCALRTAEVFGLTWDCWQDQALAIKNTAFEGRLQKNKLKTGDSRALVPIPELVQPIMRAWHALCKDTGPEALMFPTTGKRSRKGQAVPFDSTNFMERRIHPIADLLGIPRRLVTFQVMRRTVGTDLQFHGTLKDAQTALRHKSIKTTANIYMQPVPSSVRAALNARTEAVFNGGKAPANGPDR